MTLKMTILCENQVAAMCWKAEWGYSVFVEHNGTNVLFDLGFSDVYLHNAELAGIDLNSTDFVALSHVHRDHTRGMLHHPFSQPKKLLVHPRHLGPPPDFEDASIHQDYRDIQSIVTSQFDVIASAEPVEFVRDAFFLGKIERVLPFEPGCFEDDPMEDDTALAFRTPEGAVVLSGCSHAGIGNICEQAKRVTGQPLYAVIGGFHLMHEENPPVEETIDYFKKENPKILRPMHCVDFEYMARFHAEFGLPKMGAGDTIEFPLP